MSLARQAPGDGSGQPVQPWGPSYTPRSFQASLRAVDPLGTGKAKLQVQTCPAGVAFGGGACLPDVVSDQWNQVWDEDGVALAETIEGLTEGTLYRWRARALYDSPLYSHGPWRRLLGQALEADVRSMPPGGRPGHHQDLAPRATAGWQSPITYTLTFHSATAPPTAWSSPTSSPSDITDLHVSSSGAGHHRHRRPAQLRLERARTWTPGRAA